MPFSNAGGSGSFLAGEDGAAAGFAAAGTGGDAGFGAGGVEVAIVLEGRLAVAVVLVESADFAAVGFAGGADFFCSSLALMLLYLLSLDLFLKQHTALDKGLRSWRTSWHVYIHGDYAVTPWEHIVRVDV